MHLRAPFYDGINININTIVADWDICDALRYSQRTPVHLAMDMATHYMVKDYGKQHNMTITAALCFIINWG